MSLAYDEKLVNGAVAHLVTKFSPSGRKVGIMALASIFIEAWDLYSISFVLIFLQDIYKPSPLLLGLTAAATQGGALIGALIGGWLADRIGRRKIFISTMVLFVVLGVAQAFAPSMAALALLRFLLGIPLGSDLSAGFSYIMEAVSKGKREQMGNRWQVMFAAGELAAIAVITGMFIAGVEPQLIWRISLALGAVPAFILLVMRLNVPDTAIWLIQKGNFPKAKSVANEMYGDNLDMLPDEMMNVPKSSLKTYGEVFRNRTTRRATYFSWIAGAMQSSEFSTFGLYLPVIFLSVGVSGILGTNLLTFGVYTVALIAALIGPALLPKIGHRGISQWGFGLVFVGLAVAASSLFFGQVWYLPLGAAIMTFGHYWSAQNPLTIGSMVAPARDRGIATGIAYSFIKLPAFLTIFLFPIVFETVGKAWATVLVMIFPLVGFLAAKFLLPEVYGYVDHLGADDIKKSDLAAAR